MSNKVLSISVAAYNLGDMLETNLRSFCESDVVDKLEVIVTDDESKDNTIEIAEKYVKKYPNTVKLIKQKNQGPGSTVNSGIKNATGKYFRMVDGDDWVDSNNLNEFVSKLEQIDADMVVSDYSIFDNSKQQVIESKSCDVEPFKLFSFDEVVNILPHAMHNITFKTTLMKDVVLDNGFYTDVEYLLLPIKKVKTVYYFNKVIYMYRIARAGQSVSVESYKRNMKQHEKVLKRLVTFYEENKKDLTNGQAIYILNRVVGMVGGQLNILLYFDINKENKLKIKQFFDYVKNESADIFTKFKKTKKYKVLIFSNFVLYPWLAKKVLRKAEKISS